MQSENPDYSGRAAGDHGTRRRFLALAGVTGIMGLAGCTGGSDGEGSNRSGSGNNGGDSSNSESNGSGNNTAASGGPAGNNSSGGSGGSSAGLGSVTVGILNPISGAYSSLGPGQRKGAKLAIKQINESGEFGVKIDPMYADTETATDAAQQKIQRLAQQSGAKFFFGAISSSVALSLNEFAKAKQSLYFPGAAAVSVTGENCNQWVFRVETTTAQVAEAISAYSINNLGTNVWFHIADYAYGDSVYKRVSSRMKQANNNYNELKVTRSKLGSKNYGSFISQISNSNADIVVLGMTGGDLVNFTNQAANRGLTDQVALLGPSMSFQSVRAATGNSAVGTYSGVRYDPSIDLGDNQQFVKAFRKQHGEPPDNFARVGYDSVRLIARGMKKAGSTDPADVRDALSSGTFTTVLGDVTLRKSDHQATNPTWMAKLVKGDGKTADVERLSKVDGKDTLPPASELGCTLG